MRLREAGARQSERAAAAAEHPGARRGGGEEWEEGHGAAAGLLSTGARAAGGTVSPGPAGSFGEVGHVGVAQRTRARSAPGMPR